MAHSQNFKLADALIIVASSNEIDWDLISSGAYHYHYKHTDSGLCVTLSFEDWPSLHSREHGHHVLEDLVYAESIGTLIHELNAIL